MYCNRCIISPNDQNEAENHRQFVIWCWCICVVDIQSQTYNTNICIILNHYLYSWDLDTYDSICYFIGRSGQHSYMRRLGLSPEHFYIHVPVCVRVCVFKGKKDKNNIGNVTNGGSVCVRCVSIARTIYTVTTQRTFVYMLLSFWFAWNWMIFDYYQVTGAWRSFMWTNRMATEDIKIHMYIHDEIIIIFQCHRGRTEFRSNINAQFWATTA